MQLNATVIDLFAGPGGLGEGFSAFSPHRGRHPFSIAMSVEKEPSAHKTLELRAFYRQFNGNAPDEYYDYLKGEGELSREELFAAYPESSEAAVEETLGGPRALGNGSDDRIIHKRLQQLKHRVGPKVVIGGPPCQAYSLMGRARNKGIQGYRAEDDNRHFLYEEYLRVLWSIKPEVFVMENVKGILSSKVNGKPVFPTILNDLAHPGKALGKRGGKGYKIYSLVQDSEEDLFPSASTDYVIKAEKYGIPQARHRVILLGIRDDIEVTPDKLEANQKIRTTKSVIADLPSLRSGLSKLEDSPEAWLKVIRKAVNKVGKLPSKLDIDNSVLLGMVIKASKLKSRGSRYMARRAEFRGDTELARWYLDDRMNGFLNHESRGHIADDLTRYMFCAVFAKQNGGVCPKAIDFPKSLAPNHANWGSGNFVDRFKVQVANKPSSTVTSHISKDGHYYIHPDPFQCRSLTVREAARLQTFPDNYFFEGNRTQQYVQVGNAVPPLLAQQIAKIVFKVLTISRDAK